MIPALGAATGLALVAYVMWDSRTGRVVATGCCAAETVQAQRHESFHALLVSQDMAAYHGVTAETHFVENGELKERPPVPDIRQDKTDIRPDGIDVVTWTGVPKGAVFTLGNRALGTVDDGVIEWATDQGGEHPVAIEAWPARVWRGTARAF